jgi:hypothetical protein
VQQLRRLALAALVLGLAAPAAPALAAAKPCKQVSDDEGDGSAMGVKSPVLDVLSADVSSGKTMVTAILRLKSADVENDNVTKLGGSWDFNVTVGGIKYVFFARWPGIYGGTTPKLDGGLTAGNNESTPKATFQRKGNTFVWTVSRKAIAALKRPRTYMYPTSASSGALSTGGDSAFSKPGTKYLDKSPSCLASK